MLIENNKYKREICIYWKQGRCIRENNCTFAHGVNDIKKYYCQNGIKCYNENCNFSHPNGWIAYNNKRDCLFCNKGFCNKKDIKYKHIFDENIQINEKDENFQNIEKDFFNNEKFPSINKTDNINKDFIKDKTIIDDENILINVKKELYDEYKKLSKLDHNSWANSIEIEEIDNKINMLKNKYNIIKGKCKKEEIFDNDLILNIFDNEYNDEYNEIEDNKNNLPNIYLTINGIEINEEIEDIYKDKTNPYNKIEAENDILFILDKMENANKVFINDIKKLLDINEHEDKENILMFKYQLNKLVSNIYLIKNNYKDMFYH